MNNTNLILLLIIIILIYLVCNDKMNNFTIVSLENIFKNIQFVQSKESKKYKSRSVWNPKPFDVKTLVSGHWSGYGSNFKNWSNAADKFANLIGLANDKVVLEAGCGTGALLLKYHEMYPKMKLFAYDFYEPYIDILNKYLPEVTAIHNDARNMTDIPSDSFDIVYSWGAVLNYISDINQIEYIVSEHIRITKIGGILGFVNVSEKKSGAYISSIKKDLWINWANKYNFEILLIGTDNEVLGLTSHSSDSRYTIIIKKI